MIDNGKIPLDSLPDQDPSGKVKRFLKKLEMQQFSGKKELTAKQILYEANSLFKELK